MERKFKKEIGSLGAIFAFINEFVASLGIGREAESSIALVVEEFFTNMVKYTPEGGNDVAIRLSSEADRLVVSLVDTNVEPFDVTQTPEPDTLAGLSEREPGGLGIHIARKLMDSIEYEYKDRCSKITLVKILER